MLLGAQPCNSRRSVKPMIPLLGGCFNVRPLFVYCPAIGTRRISAPCRSTGRVVRRSRPPSKVGETGWTRSFGRLCLGEGAPVVYTPCSRISGKIGQRGRKQMSSAAHLTLGGVFPADRGFFAEVDPLAAPKKPVSALRRTPLLPTTGCVDRSGKPLASHADALNSVTFLFVQSSLGNSVCFRASSV